MPTAGTLSAVPYGGGRLGTLPGGTSCHGGFVRRRFDSRFGFALALVVAAVGVGCEPPSIGDEPEPVVHESTMQADIPTSSAPREQHLDASARGAAPSSQGDGG